MLLGKLVCWSQSLNLSPNSSCWRLLGRPSSCLAHSIPPIRVSPCSENSSSSTWAPAKYPHEHRHRTKWHLRQRSLAAWGSASSSVATIHAAWWCVTQTWKATLHWSSAAAGGQSSVQGIFPRVKNCPKLWFKAPIFFGPQYENLAIIPSNPVTLTHARSPRCRKSKLPNLQATSATSATLPISFQQVYS